MVGALDAQPQRQIHTLSPKMPGPRLIHCCTKTYYERHPPGIPRRVSNVIVVVG